MKTMTNVVSNILSLSNADLGVLAEALTLFDIKKAEKLQFLLTVALQEAQEEDKRYMKEAA